MSAKSCIVILGRYGDIVNCLPVARDIALKEGGKCAVMVSSPFADLLDGCSYVEPLIVSSGFTDVTPAIEQAKQMFGRVLIGKVNERNCGGNGNQCDSFTEESWRQLGYLDQYETLPLVFDLRDRERESGLIEKVRDGRPMVLINAGGFSSPYPHRSELIRLFPRTHNVVMLDKIKAHRLYDLIGLYDCAEILISSDTSTLHLAAASGVPVFNLITDKPTRWHGSRPRNNGILSLRYGESRERMKELENVPWKWKPRTWHVWSDYDMKGDTLRRHLFAKSTWKDTGWIDFPVKDNPRVIKDPMREVPFIKDLVNAAVRAAGPTDVIVLTNSDSCLIPNIQDHLSDAIEWHGPTFSFRRDFNRLDRMPTHDEMHSAERYVGSDLHAFTVQWWKKHESLLPDFVAGAEGWDWCLRELMKRTGDFAGYTDLVAHEKHENVWEQPQYRTSLPSQIHNRNLARPFLAQYGVPMG